MPRRLLPLRILFLALLFSATVHAQEDSSQHEALQSEETRQQEEAQQSQQSQQPEEGKQHQGLRDLESKLDQGITQVQILNESLASVPENDREAVMYRRDARRFGLLKELDDLARGAAKLPEEDSLRLHITARLESEFAQVPGRLFSQMSDFGLRIAAFQKELDNLSGVDKLALEAYINSLESLRLESYTAAVNLIDGRRVLDLPFEDIKEQLTRQLHLHAETLVGRLEFTGIAGKELNNRLQLDPTNTDLDTAVKVFDVLHEEDVQRLSVISGLLGKLGADTLSFKSALVQQGVSLSVRDLGADVIGSMLTDSLQGFREYLVDMAPDFAFNIVVFILIILVFRMLSRLTRRAVTAACDRSGANISILLKDTLATVSSGTVMVIGILMALSQIGISLGPMLAGLGVAGFIVGFALQDTLANFAAGGMILIYRPYDVDDFVEVAGAAGLVKKMSLVSTTITTFDNQTLVVPNSKIWGDVIKNVTAQKVRRVDMEFGIGYSDDIEKTEKVLHDILEAHELVLGKPEPLVKVHALGDSSVNFAVRPWVKTEDYWTVYWDLMREVKMRFDKEDISIPFPQRDVHFYREDV